MECFFIEINDENFSHHYLNLIHKLTQISILKIDGTPDCILNKEPSQLGGYVREATLYLLYIHFYFKDLYVYTPINVSPDPRNYTVRTGLSEILGMIERLSNIGSDLLGYQNEYSVYEKNYGYARPAIHALRKELTLAYKILSRMSRKTTKENMEHFTSFITKPYIWRKNSELTFDEDEIYYSDED